MLDVINSRGGDLEGLKGGLSPSKS